MSGVMLKGYILPGSMLGPEMNAELDARPIQKMCGAGSVSGPDFGENLTSLLFGGRAIQRLSFE